MPLDRIQPHYYTGPLKVNAVGLGPVELGTYLHAARVMLGRRGAAAAAGEVETFHGALITPDGVRMKAMCASGIYSVWLQREQFESTEVRGRGRGGFPTPYSGVVVGAPLIDAPCPLPTDAEFTISVLRRFAATPPTPVKLQRMLQSAENLVAALERQLAAAPADARTEIENQLAKARFEAAHLHPDTAAHDVTFLALGVPTRWTFLYNNPVVPPLGSTAKPVVWSQYHMIKPTMFTGRMRYIVQYLLGYGKQPTYTVARDEAGAIYADYGLADAADIVEAAPGLEAPADPASRNYLGALRYWFRYERCHGVYKSQAGRQYLIEISRNAGVLAMRLPVIPESGHLLRDDEIRGKLTDVPLGYGFPRTVLTEAERAAGVTESPFARAVRQGWVKVLLPADALAEFYRLSPTYDECGWAFSYSGRKADNVGWHRPYARPYDFPVFEHWSIEFAGGDQGAEGLYAYQHSDAGYDPALASLVATIRRVGGGNAVDVNRTVKPLKVPFIETDAGQPALASFDMLPAGFPQLPASIVPLDYQRAIPTYPRCDTPVHVFYDGEELVWLRYYRPREGDVTQQSESYDERDQGSSYSRWCMVLGGYSWGSSTRLSGTPQGFYSNRVDHRVEGYSNETTMQSQGRKVWESPYMGIEYSWPYPPFHFGYEDSNFDDEWNTYFDPSYLSRPGSPWTAKRHGFWVHVTGRSVSDQTYASSAAIPLTDRECFAMCLHRSATTESKTDYQYTAMVMQFVYDTQARLSGDWWMLRDDTVKGLAWVFWDDEHNYTRERLETPGTVLNIPSGTFSAPVADFDRSQNGVNVQDYTIELVASEGGYQQQMKAADADYLLWEWKLPNDDGTRPYAVWWLTRSVLGGYAEKMHLRLDGAMGYYGLGKSALSDEEQTESGKQVTFVGEL